MTDSFYPYSRQWVDGDDIRAVEEVLRSDFLTQGPKVPEFEEALAGYCGAEEAVVFSSGTAALHAAFFAAGIKEGDEVITSPITFVATANAALYLGARPVFVDVEPETGNLDPSLLEAAITEKTRAVAPVDFAGHPADLDALGEIAKRHDLIMIEDACHALGASYKGRKIGSISDMTVFSFHPVKPIATGEGGAVLTDDRGLAGRLRLFRTHGITREGFLEEPDGDWYYEMQELGFNYRMTDLGAALGISQLKKLDMFTERRRELAASYNRIFEGNPFFDLPVESDYARSSWHLYPVRLKDGYKEGKRELFRSLRGAGLGVQVHYKPVNSQPYYRGLGYEPETTPRAMEFYRRELSLPLYPLMSDGDFEEAAARIEKVFVNPEGGS